MSTNRPLEEKTNPSVNMDYAEIIEEWFAKPPEPPPVKWYGFIMCFFKGHKHTTRLSTFDEGDDYLYRKDCHVCGDSMMF